MYHCPVEGFVEILADYACSVCDVQTPAIHWHVLLCVAILIWPIGISSQAGSPMGLAPRVADPKKNMQAINQVPPKVSN